MSVRQEQRQVLIGCTATTQRAALALLQPQSDALRVEDVPAAAQQRGFFWRSRTHTNAALLRPLRRSSCNRKVEAMANLVDDDAGEEGWGEAACWEQVRTQRLESVDHRHEGHKSEHEGHVDRRECPPC